MSQDVDGAGRVLLVEDEVDVRDVLLQLLQLSGFQVDAVATASEARARLELASDRYAAVLCDAGLPDEDGYAMLRDLRGQHPDVGLILMSGCLPMDPDVGLTEDGIGLLQKPFMIPSFQETYERVVQRPAA